MSLIAQFPAAILDTILGRLALLFLTGAGGDLTAARNAATRMLATYRPDNEDELRLAAEIISFSFHALEALSQASSPDIPLNHLLRLRSSAVSLSRASQAAQRRLDQCQSARSTGIPVEPSITTASPAETPQPKIERALDLIATTRDTITAAKTNGQTWTQAYDQRQRDKRLQARQITENLRKNNAGQTPQPNGPQAALPPNAVPVVTSPPEPIVQQST